MATVYIAVVPGASEKLPYGTRGHRTHKGPRRSIVDFGKRGKFRVPNHWLSEKKPDPEDGRIMLEALSVVQEMANLEGIQRRKEKR